MSEEQNHSKIKRLGAWLANNVLTIIGIVGVGWFATLAKSAWDAFCERPLQVGGIAAATFLIGVWVGSVIARRQANERKAKAEGEAEEKAKHDAIAREFASLNLMQAMSMNIIAAQPNGMLTKRGSDRHRAFAERPDVAVITESSENADAVRIALTSEWNGLMNTNRHIFDEVWAEKIKEFNVQKIGAARS